MRGPRGKLSEVCACVFSGKPQAYKKARPLPHMLAGEVSLAWGKVGHKVSLAWEVCHPSSQNVSWGGPKNASWLATLHPSSCAMPTGYKGYKGESSTMCHRETAT